MDKPALTNMEPVIIGIVVSYFLIACSMSVLTYFFRKITTKEQKHLLYVIIATILIGGVGNVTKICIMRHGYYVIDVYLDFINVIITGATALTGVYLSFKMIRAYIYNREYFNEKMKDIYSILGALQCILETKPKDNKLN